MKQLSAPVAAYIAGLIDGEGYIGVTANRTSACAKGCKRGVAYRSMISVCMTDRRAIDWAQKQTGLGIINSKKASTSRSKSAFQWNIWSREASELLIQLLPFLLIKRDQAENLIAFNAIMRRPGSKGLSNAEWDARKDFWLRSRELNERGIRNVHA